MPAGQAFDGVGALMLLGAVDPFHDGALHSTMRSTVPRFLCPLPVW